MNETKVMPIFKLLRLVRDAGSTKNAKRELLHAIAMRCRPDKNFIAWPSYRLLAEDTLLDESTLKRAARALEDENLIKRVIRPNRSNCFFVNAALLQEQADKRKVELKKNADREEESPFAAPVVETSEEESDDDSWMLSGGGR